MGLAFQFGEQFAGLHGQGLCQPPEGFEIRAFPSAFQIRQMASGDSCQGGQLFLRHLTIGSFRADQQTELPAVIGHGVCHFLSVASITAVVFFAMGSVFGYFF